MLNIGGVPEHFNFPWHQAKPKFEQSGIPIHWHDYSTGTGAMVQDLNTGKLDFAVILTEGWVKAVHQGIDLQLLGFYVDSPLLWGAHQTVPMPKIPSSPVFAISRYGSGSHLMAYLYANQKGLSLTGESFKVVNNMPGAETALLNGEADIFLWEKFTTYPLVKKGTLFCNDILPTPWPCFVIVAREGVDGQAARKLLEVIYQQNKEIDKGDHLAEQIASSYQLESGQVMEWLNTVEWSIQPGLDESIFEEIQDTFLSLKVIDENKSLNPYFFE